HDCSGRYPARRARPRLGLNCLPPGGRHTGCPALHRAGGRPDHWLRRHSHRRTNRQTQGSVMKSLLLGLTLLMAATAAQDAHAQRVRISGLKKYSQITTGDFTVPAGTTTSGSVMVIRGNLDVYGNVDGAATAVLGDVIVHEGGRVRGGAVALMGHVRNEGGSILGVIKDVGATHNRSTVSFGGRPRTTFGSLVSAFLWLAVLLLVGTFVLFFM